MARKRKKDGQQGQHPHCGMLAGVLWRRAVRTSLLLSGEEGRRCQRAALESAIHGESVLLGVQIKRARAPRVAVIVGALRNRGEGEPLRSGRE